MARFTSVIYKLGINPVVDPPERVLAKLFEQAGRSKGPIPVCGKLNGADFIQTLVKYSGSWRLYINGEMLKDSKLEVGEKATVEIEYDPRPRTVPMPEALRADLENDEKANAAFEALPPSRRKEILRYLGALKTESSLRKNVDRFIRHLRGEDTDAHYSLMRRGEGD